MKTETKALVFHCESYCLHVVGPDWMIPNDDFCIAKSFYFLRCGTTLIPFFFISRRRVFFSFKTVPSSIIGGDEDVDVERRRVANVENAENAALRVYEQGLKTVEDSPKSVASLSSSSSSSSSSTSLWKFASKFAIEMLFKGASTEPTLTASRLKTAVDLMKRTEAADRMDEELYLEWIRILRNFDFDDAKNDEDFGLPAILDRALTKLPTSLSLWTIRLQKVIGTIGKPKRFPAWSLRSLPEGPKRFSTSLSVFLFKAEIWKCVNETDRDV